MVGQGWSGPNEAPPHLQIETGRSVLVGLRYARTSSVVAALSSMTQCPAR